MPHERRERTEYSWVMKPQARAVRQRGRQLEPVAG